MSNKNSDVVKLQEKVSLLTEALEREKNAKQLVEEKLTTAIDENFEKNKSFFEAFEQASSRQIQLQFLASITSELFSVHSIEEMFQHFISRISELLSDCNGITISTTTNDTYRLAYYSAQQKKINVIEWHEKHALLVDFITTYKAQKEHWIRLELPNNLIASQTLFEHSLPLFFKLSISKEEQHYILLDIDHYCYSDNLKQTLNTAAQQFSIAINRRIVEIDLSYNYHTQKLTLRKLEAAQNQLVHNEKMASLGELSAGIAHEINNPLGFISSNLQVLDEYRLLFEQAFKKIENESPKVKFTNTETDFARSDISELISSCINGVKRISTIVTSLKTFSRKGSQEYHPIVINEVIDSSLQIVWNKLKYDYKIISDLPKQLPLINGSMGELQQVFVNILVNALQAMEVNGTGTISIKSWQEGTFLIVTIKDTGCGIDENTIKYLFEPFYTTKAEGEGTGLGLSVSYAILEKHNATIDVKSKVDNGTTFTIAFPVMSA